MNGKLFLSNLQNPQKQESYFWLGVCDGKVGAYKNGKPHVPLYDVYETKVNIVGGTPFRIINVSKSSAGNTNEEKRLLLTGLSIKYFWRR